MAADSSSLILLAFLAYINVEKPSRSDALMRKSQKRK